MLKTFDEFINEGIIESPNKILALFKKMDYANAKTFSSTLSKYCHNHIVDKEHNNYNFGDCYTIKNILPKSIDKAVIEFSLEKHMFTMGSTFYWSAKNNVGFLFSLSYNAFYIPSSYDDIELMIKALLRDEERWNNIK